MKTPKSLFQIAAEKYTTMSSDLKETRRTFLYEDAATLNAAVANGGTPPKITAPQQPTFSTPGASKPGGSETPAPVSQPASVATAPGQTAAANPAAGGAAQIGPTQQQLDLVKDPTAIKIPLQNGDILFKSKTDPNVYYLQATASKIAESVKATIYTVEDIMSALGELSTGEVLETKGDMSNDLDGGEITEVAPAGDTLVREDDGPNVDQAGEVSSSGGTIGNKSVVGQDSSWTAGTGATKPAGPDVEEGSDADDEDQEADESTDAGDVTGVDNSYTQEDGAEISGKEAPGKGKDFAKGAGKAKPQTMNSEEPEIGEGESCGEGEACEEGEPEMEANPSGKESAFWVPNDDILGLKDIVGTSAKKNGTPDAQVTVGKDAAGNLVKKPTTPAHSVPNMRQYVKTNPMPGQPMRAPGSQPVDISDLDSVMGMDTGKDRALNISLNFNF